MGLHSLKTARAKETRRLLQQPLGKDVPRAQSRMNRSAARHVRIYCGVPRHDELDPLRAYQEQSASETPAEDSGQTELNGGGFLYLSGHSTLGHAQEHGSN